MGHSAQRGRDMPECNAKWLSRAENRRADVMHALLISIAQDIFVLGESLSYAENDIIRLPGSLQACAFIGHEMA